MTTYACIKSGYVVQLFTPLPSWEQIPVEQLFAPGFFDQFVTIDGLDPKPAFGWTYANGTFSPPVEENALAMMAALAR